MEIKSTSMKLLQYQKKKKKKREDSKVNNIITTTIINLLHPQVMATVNAEIVRPDVMTSVNTGFPLVCDYSIGYCHLINLQKIINLIQTFTTFIQNKNSNTFQHFYYIHYKNHIFFHLGISRIFSTNQKQCSNPKR